VAGDRRNKTCLGKNGGEQRTEIFSGWGGGQKTQSQDITSSSHEGRGTERESQCSHEANSQVGKKAMFEKLKDGNKEALGKCFGLMWKMGEHVDRDLVLG